MYNLLYVVVQSFGIQIEFQGYYIVESCIILVLHKLNTKLQLAKKD